jgi:hypothetical protein
MSATPEPTQGPHPLTVALEWAGRGVPVFPVFITWNENKQATDKRPATDNGWHDASTDPETVRDLFVAAEFRARAGQVLGAAGVPGPGGFLVFDPDRHLDPATGLARDGVALADSLGITGWTVDTASGGEHRWTRKPAGATVGNSKPQEWDGLLDVRADLGYVVLPGTVTPWGSWTARQEWTGALPQAPAEVLAALAARGAQEAPGVPWTPGTEDDPAARDWALEFLARAARRVAGTGAGNRNEGLNAAAMAVGHYVPHLLGEDEAVATLMEAAMRCGLVRDDGAPACRATIRSGLRAGMAAPQGAPLLRDASDVLGSPGVSSGEHESPAGPFADAEVQERARAAGYGDLSPGAKTEVWRLLERRLAAQWLARFDALASPALPYVAGLVEDLPDAPETWRVEGLLPQDGRLLVVAMRKTGKTTLGLNLALSLATGDPFLGRFAVEPLAPGERVALLNYEVSPGAIKAWAVAMGIPAGVLYVVNLRGRRNPLAHPEDREALAEELREAGVRVLIVDPFGRAFSGESQNDAGAVTSWLMDLDRFAEAAGAMELVLAVHAGWQGDRSRGSSALEDWPDAIAWLTRDKDEDEDTGTRYFRAEGRDVEVDEDALAMDPVTKRLSLAGTGSKTQSRRIAAMGAVQGAILGYLTEHPGATGNELEEAVGGKRERVREARDALLSQGLIEVRPGANRSRLHYLKGASS